MQENNKLVRSCACYSYGFTVLHEIQFLNKGFLVHIEALPEVGETKQFVEDREESQWAEGFQVRLEVRFKGGLG